MDSKILATVLEIRCPNGKCVKLLNARLATGESDHKLTCWNCNTQMSIHNGAGENNVRVTSQFGNVRFQIIWQDRP